MAKFKLNEKKEQNEYIRLIGKFEVEKETEKGILIKNVETEKEDWFAKSQVKTDGDTIEIAKWAYDKSDLFEDEAGEGE